MLSTLLLNTLLLNPAHAEDPVVRVEELRAAGEVDAAEATLDLLLRLEPGDLLLRQDPTDRERLLELRRGMPMGTARLSATTRLAVGQAAAGSYLLGPHLARLSYDPRRSATPYYLGALGGAALGAGSAVLAGSRPGFDEADADTILSSELLLAGNGLALGFLLDERDRLGPAWGVLGGAGAGALAGWGLSQLNPSLPEVRGGQAGALWGAGLGTAALVYAETETADGAVLPLMIGADLGAVGGVLLARELDLSTRQIALTSLGGLLGGGATGAGLGILFNDRELSPQAGALTMTAGTLAGGAVAGWLAWQGEAKRPEPADPGLALAWRLRHEGDLDSARALARLAAAGAPGEQAAIDDLLQPRRNSLEQTSATVRLVLAETAVGAATLGSLTTAVDYGGESAPLDIGLALAGGAAGATGGFLLARREDFGAAHLHALVGPQSLGLLAGGVLGSQVTDGDNPFGGMIGGSLVGTGAGLAWALSGPDHAEALAFHSGAYWGLGLSALGLSYGYGFDQLESPELVLAAGSAGMAGIGLASAHLLKMRPGQIRAINTGGATAALATGGFVWMTSRIIWYTPHGVAAIVGGSSLVGGALGFALDGAVAPQLGSSPNGALLHLEGGRLGLGLPMPRAIPLPQDPSRFVLGLSLIDQSI